MRVLIPSYEPDHRLLALVEQLRPACEVLIVDDGSGERYAARFEACAALGATVLHLPRNAGKAAALRTGFAWMLAHAPGEDVVCADSDGQHRPADIARVGAELARRARLDEDDAVVLGVRALTGDVPWRSRAGNRFTAALFGAVTGTRITDTQTGLRGYPAALLPWALEVHGERFAYELALLLDATRRGVPMVEVTIDTVYLDRNASSHFRPLIDSVRVLTPLALFAASSLLAFAIDAALLMVLSATTGSLPIAVVGARVVSASFNFAFNRRAVFRSRGRVLPQLARYGMLAVVLVAASYLSLRLLTGLGVPLLAAKVATDLTLWLASFGIQRAIVFAHEHRRPGSAPRVTVAATLAETTDA